MTPTSGLLSNYFKTLNDLTGQVTATTSDGTNCPLPDAVDWAVQKIKATPMNSRKVIFVGNGGSAAIASHMAIDFSKNGGFPALTFNDGASLTCLANDLGYENVFAHHIDSLGLENDLLVAISSSGNSQNILNAATSARKKNLSILTLSGFQPDNKLRLLGDMNLYVPNLEYGFVEITHLVLCHSILDLAMDWKPEANS